MKPEMQYEVEEETGVGHGPDGAYPTFMIVQRCRLFKNARLAAKARKADRPLFTVRVVRRTPRIVLEL